VTSIGPTATPTSTALVLSSPGVSPPPSAALLGGASAFSLPGSARSTFLWIALAVAGGAVARYRPRRAALAAVLAVAVLAPMLEPRHPGSASGVIVNVAPDPPSANVFTGDAPVVVDELVEMPAGSRLDSFTLTARFDPAVVTVALEDGGFLGSTGRIVSCSASSGGYFERTLSCTSGGNAPRASGDGVLARIVVARAAQAAAGLRASPGNGGITVVRVDTGATVLRADSGALLPLAGGRAVALAIRTLEGDVTGDCVVDLADVAAVAARYAATEGFAAMLDVEPAGGDGDVDMLDGQLVLGRLGSTCANPVPAQEPPLALPVEPLTDSDGDGVEDIADSCPASQNPQQEDGDGDGLGDACESAFGADPGNADSDGDGCADGREARVLTYMPALGGDRDPANGWDFFDVTDDHSVDFSDTLAVLSHFGEEAGAPTAQVFDRYSGDPGRPWRSAESNSGVDLTDALVNLAQFGHSCT
jgi:hypothetical protein